ncbi:MAG: L,D-transpeptidase, partial [Candidatus Angelobacter sp.]
HGLARPFGYLGPLHRQTDWTDGCIAVTNAEIEEIWKLVPVRTRVEIRP